MIGLAALLVGAGIGAAGAGSSDKKDDAAPSPAATVTATATATVVHRKPAKTKTLQPTIVKVVKTKTKTHTVTFTPQPKPAIGDGLYEVGRDINPGTWRTPGGNQCYFAILNSTNTSDIADNNNFTGPQIVTLNNGQYFDAEGGCDWRHD